MGKKIVLLFGILFLWFSGQAFGNMDAPISGYIDYKGCRDGDIYVVAFIGTECNGVIANKTTLDEPGEYLLWVGAHPPATYSICACMDTDGGGSCGNDETEPRERYPEPLEVDTPNVPINDIDITLIDPVPCPAAVPILSPTGTVTLIVLLIGSAAWFITRSRKRTS